MRIEQVNFLAEKVGKWKVGKWQLVNGNWQWEEVGVLNSLWEEQKKGRKEDKKKKETLDDKKPKKVLKNVK